MEQARLSTLPGYDLLQNGYDRMWEAGRVDVEAGNVDADPVPTATSLRWGVSIVAKVALPLAATLEVLADRCRHLCGENHTFYTRANFHVTVRSCEFHRFGVSQNDPSVRAYQTVLADVCRRHGPFEVAYCGLNANRTGAIVQGYPVTNALQALREELHDQLAELGFRRGPEEDGARHTAHSSLVVFGGPVTDPVGLCKWVGANRETRYGTARVTHLSLVWYNRTAYDVKPVLLAEFALGLRKPSQARS